MAAPDQIRWMEGSPPPPETRIRYLAGHARPMARGAHGQVLAIDRPDGVVVAHTGSAPRPPSTLLDPVLQPLLDAIGAAVP